MEILCTNYIQYVIKKFATTMRKIQSPNQYPSFQSIITVQTTSSNLLSRSIGKAAIQH